MMRDAREKLLTLVNRATSPTDDDDNEARTAAVQACKLLVKHPELVSTPQPIAQVIFEPAAVEPVPAPRAESAIHPDAERLLEWRAMLKKKSLREGHAAAPTLCADCGKLIAGGEPIVEQEGGIIATHLACANWWWNFQPAQAASFDIAG